VPAWSYLRAPDMMACYVAKRQGETTHMIASRDGKTVTRRLTANRTVNLDLAILRRMLRLSAGVGRSSASPPSRC
jgi:hypothetical protein